MNPELYTILYVGAETGNLCERPVEAYGTLPVSRWVDEHIRPIAKPDQPIYIIKTDPFGGGMVLNEQPWQAKSQSVDKVGCW